jgi:acyl-CoA reductase-like NAD-dependent aldehyde dehydrogenase
MHTTLTAVDPARPDVIRCHDPATRELLGVVPVDGPADVQRAIARARAAQAGWRETSFALRRRVLRRVADSVLASVDDLVDLVVRDSGKTRENALMGEIWTVLEKLRWTIAHGEQHLRPSPCRRGLLLHKRARLEYHPLGVIGAIVPWNYPLQNIMNPLIPALMAGNGFVVKPSEWVAWSAGRFVQLVRDALAAEGQSPELVQVVQGYGETGQALIAGGVDVLVFIGSVENGRRVLSTAAARRSRPVVLELGGKDPFIVCDDADLEAAVHGALGAPSSTAARTAWPRSACWCRRGIAERFEQRVAASW